MRKRNKLIGMKFTKNNDMSNIVKKEIVSLPQEVSRQSKIIYEANSNVPICKIEDMNIVINSIHQSINRSIADKGVTMDKNDIDYLKKNVREDILNDFSTLTLEDVNLCFKMGVRGDLGEYYGLNVVTFYQWLKKYKSELVPQTFQEVTKYIPQKTTDNSNDYDKESFDIQRLEQICDLIVKYEKDKNYNFNDIGNIHYNLLQKHGYFDGYREHEIAEMKDEAKNEFLNNIKNENRNLIEKGRSIQKIDINKVLESIENGDKEASIIDIHFKKILFKSFIVDFESNFDLPIFKKELFIKIKREHGK